MTWFSAGLGFDLLWVFVWGALLMALHFGLFWLLDILPLGEDRRSQLRRLRPLFGLLLAVTFALFSIRALFSRYPEVLPIALLLVLVGFFLGSQALVRDFFAGVALRAENSFQVGDHIRIGDTLGRIVELGPRAISLATPEGDRALIPYSTATRLPLVRTRIVNQGSSRTFTLGVPKTLTYAAVCRRVERAALLSHWGSVSRVPEIAAREDGRLEVTVFALAEDHTDDVERAIRAAVEDTPAL